MANATGLALTHACATRWAIFGKPLEKCPSRRKSSDGSSGYYERMQGVVDQAHWFEFALVLTSILRTGRDRRALLAVTRAWNA